MPTADATFMCDKRCNKKRLCGRHKCNEICCVVSGPIIGHSQMYSSGAWAFGALSHLECSPDLEITGTGPWAGVGAAQIKLTSARSRTQPVATWRKRKTKDRRPQVPQSETTRCVYSPLQEIVSCPNTQTGLALAAWALDFIYSLGQVCSKMSVGFLKGASLITWNTHLYGTK